MDQQGRCPTISGSVSLDIQFLCHRFVAKEFRNGNFINARRVVEGDGNINSDRFLANQDDALEKFPFLLKVCAVDNGVTDSGGKFPGVGKNQGLSPFFQRKMGRCPGFSGCDVDCMGALCSRKR